MWTMFSAFATIMVVEIASMGILFWCMFDPFSRRSVNFLEFNVALHEAFERFGLGLAWLSAALGPFPLITVGFAIVVISCIGGVLALAGCLAAVAFIIVLGRAACALFGRDA
jgi:hypothetical protein